MGSCGLQKSDGTVFINPARIKFAPLLERKPAKISCERKTMKWATKLAIKRKAKGKRRERVKNRNKFGKKKSSNFGLCAEKRKSW